MLSLMEPSAGLVLQPAVAGKRSLTSSASRRARAAMLASWSPHTHGTRWSAWGNMGSVVPVLSALESMAPVRRSSLVPLIWSAFWIERVSKTGPDGVLVFGLGYGKMLLPPSPSRNLRIFCSVVGLLPFMI